METDKSQDLQLASWRSRRTEGVGSDPEANRLKAQEGPFQFKSESGEPLMSGSKAGRQAGGVPSYSQERQPFCFIQAFNRLHKAHPH